MKVITLFLSLLVFKAQAIEYRDKFLVDKNYIEFKESIKKRIKKEYKSKAFEANRSFTKKEDSIGCIALTFDACDGRYNKELIDFLISENIPATLFLSGKWIDRNIKKAMELAKNNLFEIENHGLRHRICALSPEKIYHLKNTKNVDEMIDEIELNNRKIQAIFGRRPLFYRPAGAYMDYNCQEVADLLEMKVAGYDNLAGDSLPKISSKKMADNILKNARHGMVVLMHLNHPERQEVEALKIVIPILRKKGFSFCFLKDFVNQE